MLCVCAGTVRTPMKERYGWCDYIQCTCCKLGCAPSEAAAAAAAELAPDAPPAPHFNDAQGRVTANAPVHDRLSRPWRCTLMRVAHSRCHTCAHALRRGLLLHLLHQHYMSCCVAVVLQPCTVHWARCTAEHDQRTLAPSVGGGVCDVEELGRPGGDACATLWRSLLTEIVRPGPCRRAYELAWQACLGGYSDGSADSSHSDKRGSDSVRWC